MKLLICGKQTIRRAGLGIAALGFALVLSYILLGHGLIRAMYESNLSIFARVMQGRAVTPLQAYFAGADLVVLKLGLSLVLAGALWWLVFKNPLGIILSGMSFLIGSFVVFLLLDQFPVLIKPLHWDIIPHFNFRLTYVRDAVFGFREKPYNKGEITNFRGSAYSPLYGIDVPMSTLHWQVDSEGFRNQLDTSVADIAIIGSSFTEYGDDFEDTYPSQLEIMLAGPKVVNLSKAGYGPFHYLQVLKSYAIKKKVRYVIISFHPSSETDYKIALWLKGVDFNSEIYSVLAGGIFTRYRMAVQQTGNMLISGGWTALQLGFRSIVGTDFIHPDVAVLKLPNGVSQKLLLLEHHSTRSADDLLNSPEWNVWRQILVAFKELSEENQIVPLLLYIPAVTEIYSEYITPQSGTNWLRVRESLIATQSTDEEAARRLAAKVGIEMISLRSAYQQAARQGKLVYYPLDIHWNEEGRKIAASVTAEALRAVRFEKRDTRKARATEPLQVAEPASKYSLMERKISGEIRFWNQSAEELYGWTKEEAIGKISHKLLQTQFPESLEQINDKLLQYGRWKGKLVHATRDGRRIEVVSEWIWDPRRLNYDVVEINKRSANS